MRRVLAHSSMVDSDRTGRIGYESSAPLGQRTCFAQGCMRTTATPLRAALGSSLGAHKLSNTDVMLFLTHLDWCTWRELCIDSQLHGGQRPEAAGAGAPVPRPGALQRGGNSISSRLVLQLVLVLVLLLLVCRCPWGGNVPGHVGRGHGALQRQGRQVKGTASRQVVPHNN